MGLNNMFYRLSFAFLQNNNQNCKSIFCENTNLIKGIEINLTVKTTIKYNFKSFIFLKIVCCFSIERQVLKSILEIFYATSVLNVSVGVIV